MTSHAIGRWPRSAVSARGWMARASSSGLPKPTTGRGACQANASRRRRRTRQRPRRDSAISRRGGPTGARRANVSQAGGLPRRANQQSRFRKSAELARGVMCLESVWRAGDFPKQINQIRIIRNSSLQNHRSVYAAPRPASPGGALGQSSPNVRRDAVAAGVPKDERLFADGEVVWSWRPDAGVKFATMLRITRMMGARKPVPRGERDISRKATAQGMPDCLR